MRQRLPRLRLQRLKDLLAEVRMRHRFSVFTVKGARSRRTRQTEQSFQLRGRVGFVQRPLGPLPDRLMFHRRAGRPANEAIRVVEMGPGDFDRLGIRTAVK